MCEFSGILSQIRKGNGIWHHDIDGIYKAFVLVFVACRFSCFTVFHDAKVKCL